MIEDDGGFMRRETARDWDSYDDDEPTCIECGSTEDNCPCEEFLSDYEEEYDGQPTEYEEWQDFYGGDDWDHGQYDEF